MLPQNQFSQRATGAGITIVTQSMADYKAILSYLSKRNPHRFTTYLSLISLPKHNYHLPTNAS